MPLLDLDIVGFLPFSSTAWSGKNSAVVFLPGCNFSCGYCHSYPLVLYAGKLPRIENEKIFSGLQKNRGSIQGIVVSGGEPTLHGARLVSFLEKIKNLGFETKLDTNGSNPFMVKTLIDNNLLDFISLDIKAAYTPAKYFSITKKKSVLSKVMKSIDIVISSGIDYEFSFTFVPGLHSPRDVFAVTRYLKGAKLFVLQQFRQENGVMDKAFESMLSPSYDELVQIAQNINGIAEVRVRTVNGDQSVSCVQKIEAAK
jgi:pyruvate formate lyase activating enzyme